MRSFRYCHVCRMRLPSDVAYAAHVRAPNHQVVDPLVEVADDEGHVATLHRVGYEWVASFYCERMHYDASPEMPWDDYEPSLGITIPVTEEMRTWVAQCICNYPFPLNQLDYNHAAD